MSRPIFAAVDSAALAHNLQMVKKFAPNASRMAVIKANAYGHGLFFAAQALRQSEGFALLDLDDALSLREAGFRQKIVLLEGFFTPKQLQQLAQYDISTVIHSVEQLRMLESARFSGKIDVFLKLNSGMNRLGFRAENFAAALSTLRACEKVGSIALMTHFACADEAAGIDSQFEVFKNVAAAELPWSLANSAAIVRFPQTHGDWTRPGIMLYGASPMACESAESLGLVPVMTLQSEIIAVQQVAAGEAVGYGALFRAEHDMRIGIVACGYADGYPRHAPTGTPIVVAGRTTRTLGRVSMDMLYADLSGIPDAAVGSKVTLWGQGLPVEEVARAAGTISYELLCALAPRVPIKICP